MTSRTASTEVLSDSEFVDAHNDDNPINENSNKPKSIHDYLQDIQTLTHKITTTINAGKSVTAENKKAIVQYAADIKGIAKQIHTLDEANTTLTNIKEDIKVTIREEISKAKLNTNSDPDTKPSTNTRKSYAAVAKIQNSNNNKGKKPIPKPVTKPALIVASSDAETTSKDVLINVRKEITFRGTGYAPATINTVTNNKVRIEFDTLQQRDETLHKINTTNNLTAEPVRRLKPMVILKGISREINPTELIDIILGQNPTISNVCNTPKTEINIRFIRDNKNSKLYNAALITTPHIWQALIALERVNIEYQRVHLENLSPFTQCFACLQFGHTQSRCTAQKTPCRFCASEEHQSKDCPNKQNPTAAKCHNCHSNNNKYKQNTDTAHFATSNQCPVVKKLRNEILARVDYGY
ncbi:hypothetical protein O3G_MSEX009068 [Manduca sexta]|uniref:CCHC-type domain-containing protein n=1 Tax=Manduca sexta TaxID=7130 RepID=A0A922CR34_MANSE|nr:hypothetical protein O3G_MSEX009068 [Manduca sexta]